MTVRVCASCLGILPALLVGCVTEKPRRSRSMELRAEVEASSRPGDGVAVGPLVWGLGPGPLGGESGGLARTGAEPVQQGQDPKNEQDKEREEARIRSQFGSNVLIGPDGRVTKQYFLAGELGSVFLKLINNVPTGQAPVPLGKELTPPPMPAPGTKVGGPDAKSILGRMLNGREVEVTYLPDFEVLSGAALIDKEKAPAVTGAPLPTDEKIAPRVALVLVTGQPSSLVAFEDALDLFYSSIPQIEITVQVIEYSQSSALAFGVQQINATTPNLRNLSSRQLVQAFTGLFPLRQPVVGSNPVTDVGLFTLGGIHESWELNMVLQMLEANNLADITSSPRLVVRNGGVASISTITEIPFPKAKITQLGAEVATDIAFKPVGVKMNIIPVIAGTDSVILQIYADVSAVTGFADTQPVVTPITSTRNAVTTVYLKNQHSLLIGGLQSETVFESETKVPILGDIPILGFLFRSTQTSKSKSDIAFQITPRIVTDRGQRVERAGGR